MSLVFLVLFCLFTSFDFLTFVPFRSETRCFWWLILVSLSLISPASLAFPLRRLNGTYWPFHCHSLSNLLEAMTVEQSAI